MVLVLRDDKSANIKEGDKASLSICIWVSFMEAQSQNNRTKENKIIIYRQRKACVPHQAHFWKSWPLCSHSGEVCSFKDNLGRNVLHKDTNIGLTLIFTSFKETEAGINMEEQGNTEGRKHVGGCFDEWIERAWMWTNEKKTCLLNFCPIFVWMAHGLKGL